MNRWTLTLAGLRGEAWPPLPDLPGRLIVCGDAPLSADELDAIDSPTELALAAGITRQAAAQRIAKRKAAACTPP
jgi:hypothetical protein